MKVSLYFKNSAFLICSLLLGITAADRAKAQGLDAAEFSLSFGGDHLEDDEYSFVRYNVAAEFGIAQGFSLQYDLERTDTDRRHIDVTDVDYKHTLHLVHDITPSSKAGFYVGRVDKDRLGDGHFLGLEYKRDFASTSIEFFAEKGTNNRHDYDLKNAGVDVSYNWGTKGKIGASYSLSRTRNQTGTFRGDKETFGLSFEYELARNLAAFARIERDIYSESTSNYSVRNFDGAIEAGVVMTLDRNKRVSFGRRAPNNWQ